jgi:hypothetical protein
MSAYRARWQQRTTIFKPAAQPVLRGEDKRTILEEQA